MNLDEAGGRRVIKKPNEERGFKAELNLTGAGDGIRTRDSLLGRQEL